MVAAVRSPELALKVAVFCEEPSDVPVKVLDVTVVPVGIVSVIDPVRLGPDPRVVVLVTVTVMPGDVALAGFWYWSTRVTVEVKSVLFAT